MADDTVADTVKQAIEHHRDSEIPNDREVVHGSVRESLEQAVEHHQDDSPENKKLFTTLENNRANIKEQRNETAVRETLEQTIDEEKDKKRATAESEGAPPELAAHWDRLTPEVREYLLGIEAQKEEQKRKIENYNEIDAVFDAHPDLRPYKDDPKLKTLVISRLFEWVKHLDHPDMNYKFAVLQALAARYGIDLEEAVRQAPYKPQQAHQYQQQAYAEQLRQAQEYQYWQQVQAAGVRQQPKLDNWSKNKVHFGNEKVKNKMGEVLKGMLISGAIPISETDLSQPKFLNMAYKAACELEGLDPAFVRQNSSLKQKGSKTNNYNNRPPKSVGDSIREVLREAKRD